MSETRAVFMSRPRTRIYLSPVEKSDLPIFQKYLNCEEIATNLQGHHPLMESDEDKWYENLSKYRENNRVCSIVMKEANEVIGLMGLHNIDWISRTATTGAFIGKVELLGKGLGTEAKMLWLKYAFRELNLLMIISRVYSFNERSIRYLEKCGYRKIAVYPDYIFRDGKYHDLIHLMVNREMWEPLWLEFEERMKGEKNV